MLNKLKNAIDWIDDHLALTAVLTGIVLTVFICLNIITNTWFSLKLDYQFGLGEKREEAIMDHIKVLYGKTARLAKSR